MPDSLEEHNNQVRDSRNAIRKTIRWLKRQKEETEKEGKIRAYNDLIYTIEAGKNWL